MLDDVLAKCDITRVQFEKLLGLWGRYQGKDASGHPIVAPDGPIPYMGEDLPSDLLPWNFDGSVEQALRKKGQLSQEEADVLAAALHG